MEKVKFRAWDNKSKEWLLGYEGCGGFSMFGECMLFEEWSSIINRFIVQQTDRKPDDLILTQYSNKNDNNGKEIYAGDIMRNRYKDKYEEKGFGTITLEIVFKDGSFGWIGENTKDFYSFAHDSLVDYEVIGNVFQNQKLLIKKLKP